MWRVGGLERRRITYASAQSDEVGEDVGEVHWAVGYRLGHLENIVVFLHVFCVVMLVSDVG